MRKNNDSIWFLVIGSLIGVLLIQFIFSLAPVWIGSDVNYTLNEDINYYHNFSANVSDYSGGITFAVDTDSNINWTNGSGTYSVTASDVSRWMRLEDSDIGNFTINATFDNQTGFFVVPMQAVNDTDGLGSLASFEFMVNATNDAPVFTNINDTYNMSSTDVLSEYLNASDEESHYPLIFNITFLSNCSLASWSSRTNCTLFNFTETENTSALMDFIPTNNDVGVYWANITVMDAANQSGCPHDYCVNSSYAVNKTTAHSQLVVFNTFASLEVNTTNCTNKMFQANSTGWCLLNITTKGDVDELNLSSYSILRNYGSGQSDVVNTSWFQANNVTSSSSFYKTVNITVTPWKTEIGNWTINFTVVDNTHSENTTVQINVWVNKTYDDTPNLDPVGNVQSSINFVNSINLSVYDDDLLIPDKNSSFGGFNESINFTTTILNQSDLTEVLTIEDYDLTILSMPVSGSNITTARITINASSAEIGNYTLNITINDSQGLIDSQFFNFSAINNTAPEWDATINTTYIIYEDNNTYINFSLNVTDIDVGDTLTYSYVYDIELPSFDVNSTTGLVNFTPGDSDVGQHIINITVTDSNYLSDTESFNFTIFNINDEFIILNLDGTNVTPTSNIWNGSSINATEDNYSILTLWIEDDDFKIPDSQKAVFYNEYLNISLNITGINISLFSFVHDPTFSLPSRLNKSKYSAIFTPRKADLGNYSFILNVTDNSNFSNYITFNMTVYEIDHNPNMTGLENQTSAVNRSLYYNINVTDLEQGNDTTSIINENFTFSYEFLNDGTTPGFFNTSVFNDTLGIINVTFNNTQNGKYHINITVNDTTGREDFEDFWISVYGLPNMSVPSSSAVFNLVENSSYVLNFSANHSVGDNITYNFYIDSISYDGSDYTWNSLLLRGSESGYGNGSNHSWGFTANFTDETYSKYKNLTLVVYPSNSDLANASTLNTTQNWALNVTHTNYPISFDGNIDGQGPTVYTSDITIDLNPYFYDPDNADLAIAETVTFTIVGNTSLITGSVSSGWILTLSASQAVTGRINVTGADSTSNDTSNSFVVEFVAPSGSSSSSSSSGGTTIVETPVSLKILMPDPISAYKKDKIELPLTLYNDGSVALYNIDLSGTIALNETIPDDVSVELSVDHFNSLSVNQKENLTMTIDVNTEREGLYEITVFADVANPDYSDWGKMYLTVKEGEKIQEKILFTEEFIAENPECLELKELVEEAKNLMRAGKNEAAMVKANEAINACKLAIEQAATPRITQIMENKLYRYIVTATLVVFLGGLGYYSYKRMKLKRRRGSGIQQDIKNIKFLEK